MPSVYIKTYGCQMNERDSEQVARSLVMRGYRLDWSRRRGRRHPAEHVQRAGHGRAKSVGKMGMLQRLAREATASRSRLSRLHGPESRRGAARVLTRVDLVAGTQKFHRVADYVDELLRRSGEQPHGRRAPADRRCRRRGGLAVDDSRSLLPPCAGLPRLSRSCRAAICTAPFASFRKPAAPNAGAPSPISSTRCAASRRKE